MRHALLFVAAGVILGAIIHIAVVLMVPFFASDDAWARMGRFGGDQVFHRLPPTGSAALTSLDPHMLNAVCRFTLDDGPVRITASLPDDFWSIAIYDRRGRNVFSLNDRSAVRPELDLAVITPVQMAELRQDPPEFIETAIVVEAPIEAGFVLIRVFVADPSLLPIASQALASADCAGAP